MKYDARACSFNMDTGCVELLLRDGRKIFGYKSAGTMFRECLRELGLTA